MSAPVRTVYAQSLPTRLNKRHVEPDARRRASDYSAHGQTRGRGACKNAAVVASLAEWGF